MEPSQRGLLARLYEVLLVAGKLGLTSFGGPVAHLGYFREEYVVRRKWVDEATYVDLVALCQFLPGPASSQVGIALGVKRAGLIGGLAAWIGFTLPSALALILFAYGVTVFGNIADVGWLHGLKVVAVAVVALAVWGMARSLCPDRARASLAIASAIAALAWRSAVGQVVIIVIAGFIGWRLLRQEGRIMAPAHRFPVGRRVGTVCLALFGALLIGLPLAARATGNWSLAVFDSFYRAGSLVFGGGHVILPLLQAEVVPPGWVTNDQFIAGYGATQAVPGPLLTFAAYLGTTIGQFPVPWLGGMFTLAAIFLPAYLLVVGALPFWDGLRNVSGFRAALQGINAAVVGLLLSALYDPVWTSAILAPADIALGMAAFALLAFWKRPPWLVVIVSAVGGALIAMI
ncbi:MAG: chromate efflux transporter [Chloroflexi bacterium]|nr:chromate efflux transporter [Chloroflexota bacterium]